MTPNTAGPAFEIRRDDLRGPEIRTLLEEHLRALAALSPAESMHALDLERLRRPEIDFWTVWDGPELLGCGALKRHGDGHGELKSMRTAARALRRGVARALLGHVLAEARAAGLTCVSLETGTGPAFAPAHALYAGFGFQDCGPFADYAEDPHSRFMTLTL